MKVAFVLNQFPILSETFILNQITGLIENGIEVDIYANTPSYQSQVHSDVVKYKLMDVTSYFHIPDNRIIRKLNSIGVTLTALYKYPVLMQQCLLSGLKHVNEVRLQKIELPYVVKPFLGKQKYQIIHCHFGPNAFKGLLLKKLGLFEGKLVTTFHGYDITRYLQLSSAPNPYKPLFEQGDFFLPISKLWKDRLIELGCNEQKIGVHRMGIDCTKFSFTPRHLSQNGRIRIVTVARLVEKKGVEYGIEAMTKLSQRYDNIEYNIIGDGELRSQIQQSIEDNGVGNIVKLLGWKQQHEIIEILKDSHILLAPSVTAKDGDREGIPVVLIEAMAMGLPVISTQHSGIPELVENDVSGFLVPERDAGALADKLIYLIENSELWAEMGQAGRKCIEENYDINKLNYQLLSLYKELLAQK